MRLRLSPKWKRVLLVLALVPLTACSLSQLKSGPESSSNSGKSSGTYTAFKKWPGVFVKQRQVFRYLHCVQSFERCAEGSS